MSYRFPSWKELVLLLRAKLSILPDKLSPSKFDASAIARALKTNFAVNELFNLRGRI